MAILESNSIRSSSSSFNSPVQFLTSGGTQNGTLCRAWVNFNGTGTVAIRADFNVSSITDNSTGDYTVNFTNAMSDANYAVSFWGQRGNASGSNYGWLGTYDTSGGVTQTSSTYRCNSHNSVGTLTDWGVLYVSIFR